MSAVLCFCYVFQMRVPCVHLFLISDFVVCNQRVQRSLYIYFACESFLLIFFFFLYLYCLCWDALCLVSSIFTFLCDVCLQSVCSLPKVSLLFNVKSCSCGCGSLYIYFVGAWAATHWLFRFIRYFTIVFLILSAVFRYFFGVWFDLLYRIVYFFFILYISVDVLGLSLFCSLARVQRDMFGRIC